MRVVKVITWNVVSSGKNELVFHDNQLGDEAINELYVNTLSDCTLKVKGYVSTDDTTGMELKGTDMVNLEKKDSMTTKGNYLFIVDAYYKVDIEITGTSKVILKTLI